METLLALSLNSGLGFYSGLGFSATILTLMFLSLLPAQQPSAIAIPVRSREE